MWFSFMCFFWWDSQQFPNSAVQLASAFCFEQYKLCFLKAPVQHISSTVWNVLTVRLMQQLIFMLKIFNFLYCHCIVTESVVWKMITESQNGLGRELRDHLVPNQCLGQGCLVGPHPIQPNLIRQSAHSGEKA